MSLITGSQTAINLLLKRMQLALLNNKTKKMEEAHANLRDMNLLLKFVDQRLFVTTVKQISPSIVDVG